MLAGADDELVYQLLEIWDTRYMYECMYAIPVYSLLFVIVIVIFVESFIPSRNLDEVFTYNHIWIECPSKPPFIGQVRFVRYCTRRKYDSYLTIVKRRVLFLC